MTKETVFLVVALHPELFPQGDPPNHITGHLLEAIKGSFKTDILDYSFPSLVDISIFILIADFVLC